MNKLKTQGLIAQWTDLICVSERISKQKARKASGGLDGRIKRTIGGPIIFDLQTYKDQKVIQDSLCEELPDLTELIRSKPEIMDGHPWTRTDFLELYFSHYRIVVERIQRIIDKTINV